VARLREPLLRGAHLLVLSAFALAQPLFDILGRNAEFFAVRGSTAGDIVLFALAVTFLPALALLAVELLVGAVHAGSALVLHLVFVGVLTAVFAIQAFERAGLDGTTVLIAAAVAAGVAAALAAWRVRAFRSFLTVLSPAPLVFGALFLFSSPVSDIVFADETDVELADVRAEAPVVIVLLDELPTISLLDDEGEIDRVRYPSFARLAQDGVWFRNTTTLSASTTLAVPSILTGNAPRRGKLPLFQEHPRNLFTLLGGSHRLNVTESQTRLCPPSLCRDRAEAASARLSSLYSDARVVYLHLLAPPALEERLPAIDEAWGDFGRAEVAADTEPAAGSRTKLPDVDIRTFYVGRLRELNGFVDSLGPASPGRRPTLSFLHVLFPHGPWIHFPDGTVSGVENPRAPGRTGELWWDNGLALQAYQRHLLQLGYTDALIGRIVDRLRRAGTYERSLVVVLADHGVSFRGGNKRRVATRENLPELAFVPFLIKLPGRQTGRVVDEHVRIVDVLPTIADALGVRLPWKVDGRSALAEDFTGSETVRVGRIAAPLARMLDAREASLRRQLSLFGAGNWDLYASGRLEPLLGKPVGTLAVEGRDGSAAVDATGSRLLRSLRPGLPVVPSPLSGTLEGVAKGERLLAAVNGRIAGVAQAYATGSTIRFSVLVPPSSFRPGRNAVRFFTVVDDAGATVRARELETSLSGG
jgi:hypothetical protein